MTDAINPFTIWALGAAVFGYGILKWKGDYIRLEIARQGNILGPGSIALIIAVLWPLAIAVLVIGQIGRATSLVRRGPRGRSTERSRE